ncbi:MAG: DUF177 domain-containing protein [Acidobacteria bacterium]|nr:DUF177 domain-containing protein [Acidobacteriota bacterium]MBV9148007.1 DUF177 domain-containing protein [Acidobacteriota bacterium]
MFISLQDLEVRKVEFSQQFAPGTLDLVGDLRQSGSLKTQGQAELLSEHRGGKNVVKDIRVRGDFSTEIEIRCARCIEPVPTRIGGDFDLLYRPLGVDAGHDERSISEAETEIGYYSGEGIQLEDVLREQVLLALPLRTVCSESCRGLCPGCGKNLNTEACTCGEQPPDPRWAVLADIKNKLK